MAEMCELENPEEPPDYETVIDFPSLDGVPPPPYYEAPLLEGLPSEAPPSYAEAAACPSKPSLPSLAYADFLPRCVTTGCEATPPIFDDFRTTMVILNDWMEKNPQYQTIRCECIERKVSKKGELETESTIYHESAFGKTSYVRGIRLWLVPNSGNAPVQQLRYLNVVPSSRPRTVTMGARMVYIPGHGKHIGVKQLVFPEFQQLDEVLVKVNETLKPLDGEILTVDCFDVKYGESWRPRCVQPDVAYWSDTGESSKLYLTVLRIFYVLGPPVTQEIGIEDFAPQCTHWAKSHVAKPRFEGYTDVLQRAGQWISSQQDIRVSNIQTIRTKANLDVNKGEIERNTKRMDFVESPSTVIFCRVVRVAYVRQKAAGAQIPHMLSTKAFVPVRFSRTKSETTSETVQRINAWLSCTGATVLGADTLTIEFDAEIRKAVDTESTSYNAGGHHGHHWITVIRLYLDGKWQEPPPEVLAPIPAYVDQKTKDGGKSSSCTIT